MAKPWPPFITPNMDAKPMRRDTPRQAAGNAGAQRTADAPSAKIIEPLNRPMPTPRPKTYTLADLKTLLAASLRDGDPKPGYGLRVRHLRSMIATHEALARSAAQTAQSVAPLAPDPRPA